MFYTNHQGNKNKIKDLSSNGVGAPSDRSSHIKQRKNALMLLLHIHNPISSNIRAFSAIFPVVIISMKTNFILKLLVNLDYLFRSSYMSV